MKFFFIIFALFTIAFFLLDMLAALQNIKIANAEGKNPKGVSVISGFLLAFMLALTITAVRALFVAKQ